jgi:hypothetical protein
VLIIFWQVAAIMLSSVIFLIFLSLWLGHVDAASDVLKRYQGDFRQLQAAKRQRALPLPGHAISPKTSLDLDYAERELNHQVLIVFFKSDVALDDNHDYSPVFASRIQAHSDRSLLHVEDFEHELQSISCRTDEKTGVSTITLKFLNEQFLETAKREIKSLKDGAIITSHPGCNEVGERAIYRFVNQHARTVSRLKCDGFANNSVGLTLYLQPKTRRVLSYMQRGKAGDRLSRVST